MKFKVGDRVIINPTVDQLEDEFFQEISGAMGEITEIYSEDYLPDVKFVEVTLDNPVEMNDQEIRVVPGLSMTELEAVNSDEDYGVDETRAMTFESFNQLSESEEDEVDEPSWYYGIADCRGVESFVKEPDRNRWAKKDRLHSLGLSDTDSSQEDDKQALGRALGMMSLRAMHNQQRHPVVYRVLLDQETAEEIEDLLANGDYEDALITIKDRALEVQLGRGHGANLEKRWNMIPNPDLDPMG